MRLNLQVKTPFLFLALVFILGSGGGIAGGAEAPAVEGGTEATEGAGAAVAPTPEEAAAARTAAERVAKVAALIKLLCPPPEPKVLPAAETLTSANAAMVLSLRDHRLRVFAGATLAVEVPVAHGRPFSPTTPGEFSIEEKTIDPKNVNYGLYRTTQGVVLARGVFPALDALPAGGVFEPVIPKCAFKLSGGGPLIFAGEATGAATTDGAVVIPDKVALFLYEKLGPGVKIRVEE